MVFICTRKTRSKSALPVVAGTLTPYLPRACATSTLVQNCSAMLSRVMMAGQVVECMVSPD
jgi:hypothetical protein